MQIIVILIFSFSYVPFRNTASNVLETGNYQKIQYNLKIINPPKVWLRRSGIGAGEGLGECEPIPRKFWEIRNCLFLCIIEDKI